jgi:hypothetical protein
MKKLILVLLIIISEFTFTQTGSSGTSDARTMGMAKTYNSSSFGIFSVGINPANILLNETNTIEISTLLPLPKISAKSGTDFISINEFNYFFGGVNGNSRLLNDRDKDYLLNLFKSGGLIFASINTNLFSISFNAGRSIGAFAFSINDFAGGKILFPQAVVDLALSGNDPNKEYLIEEEEVKSWWIRNYSLSYACDIPLKNIVDKLSAGITLKLVHGFYYIGSERIDTYIRSGERNEITGSSGLLAYTSFSNNFGIKYDFEEDENKSSNIHPFMDPAGIGFGFDLGFTASLSNSFTLSLAVTDIGDITWKDNTAKFTTSGNIYLDDITVKSQWDSVKKVLTAEGSPTGTFKTDLASALRFGASYFFNKDNDKIPGTLLLAFDYNQGFNSYPGNSTTPRFSVGAEWKPGDWIPFFRTGFSFGGLDGFGWALGLGLDMGIVELNFATSDMHSYFAPNSAEFLSLAFDSRWKF